MSTQCLILEDITSQYKHKCIYVYVYVWYMSQKLKKTQHM